MTILYLPLHLFLLEMFTEEFIHGVRVPFLNAECFHDLFVVVHQFDDGISASKILDLQPRVLTRSITLDKCWNRQ